MNGVLGKQSQLLKLQILNTKLTYYSL
jgi:hypothetical protein